MVTQTVETTETTAGADRSAFTIYHVVNFIIGLIQIVLALRFLLRLLGANPASGFTQFVFDISAPLMAPFVGIFGSTVAEGSVVEWSVLVAMAVYALLSYIVLQAVSLIVSRI